jgi:Sulfotransferase family
MAGKPYYDYDDMVAAAEKSAACSDWGPDSPLALLHVLVQSLNEEANLNDVGRARAKDFVHDILVARLRIIDDHKRYPEIAKQKIDKPIFLTGSQRSGTSYLNAVLASDPKNIGVFEWQLHAPSPPANHPDFDHEPDIRRVEQAMQSQGFLEPFMRDKHDYDPRMAGEDSFAQCYSLISVTYPFFFGVPGYGQHIAGLDNTPAYIIEKMFLQSLQYGVTGKQWVLKSPLHLSMLGELFKVFPDVRLVVNHRDPTRTLSSLMSLLVAHRRQFGSSVTVDRAFALVLMEGIAGGYEDMMRRRKDPKVDAVFVDVNYVDLERDAISQAQKIYDHFGMTLGDSSKRSMAKYIAENRKGKHGKHRHTLEESGLRVEEVRERFKNYLDAYDVPRE